MYRTKRRGSMFAMSAGRDQRLQSGENMGTKIPCSRVSSTPLHSPRGPSLGFITGRWFVGPLQLSGRRYGRSFQHNWASPKTLNSVFSLLVRRGSRLGLGLRSRDTCRCRGGSSNSKAFFPVTGFDQRSINTDPFLSLEIGRNFLRPSYVRPQSAHAECHSLQDWVGRLGYATTKKSTALYHGE